MTRGTDAVIAPNGNGEKTSFYLKEKTKKAIHRLKIVVNRRRRRLLRYQNLSTDFNNIVNNINLELKIILPLTYQF